MQLGTKIRDLRLRRGLTVQQLAEASHLSKGFISQVENGRSFPSLATLRDLAAALQTSAGYLVVEEDGKLHVVRAADRRRIEPGGNPSAVEVLSALPRHNLELLLAELPAGRPPGHERHRHHAEECVLCLEGRVRLVHGEELVVLEAGDSCHYDGRISHSIENAGPQAARVILAMTPAAFEPAPNGSGPGTMGNGRPEQTPTTA
jgi:transcriptional regulator with XRE-family HTH domain